VNLTIVQKVRLRLPPTPEQERIVVVLDAHDARIRAEEAYRDKLKQLKKGLMDDLLTGRVRVKSTTNHTQEADDDQASLSSVPKMQTED
jgi:type I restriction enzyme S subunit